jgi:hypothetical protein
MVNFLKAYLKSSDSEPRRYVGFQVKEDSDRVLVKTPRGELRWFWRDEIETELVAFTTD